MNPHLIESIVLDSWYVIVRFVRRWKMAVRRNRKQRRFIYGLRLMRASTKLWSRFRSMPVAPKSLEWLERNQRRLDKISAKWLEL